MSNKKFNVGIMIKNIYYILYFKQEIKFNIYLKQNEL